MCIFYTNIILKRINLNILILISTHTLIKKNN